METPTPCSLSDHDFIEKLYGENVHFLYYTASRYVSSREDREDLVHDTLMRIMKCIETVRGIPDSKLKKYMVLTMHTAFVDSRRRQGALVQVSLDDELVKAFIQEEFYTHGGAMDSTERLRVQFLKESLPDREWILLEGKYILGLDRNELGTLLGVSPESVRSLLSRARKHAKELIMNTEGDGELGRKKASGCGTFDSAG